MIERIIIGIKLTSGSKRGGTGGGVTETPRFATGGGGAGGETLIVELLPMDDKVSIRPNGRWPPKPATWGSGVSPGVSGLSSISS